MPNAIKWVDPWVQRANLLTTELNALAAGSRSAAGTELANQTNLDQYGKLEVTVDFVSAPAANGYFNVYMVTAPNGTNYEDGSNTIDPGTHTLVAIIPVRADSAAQRLASSVFMLQPAKTKFILENKTDQAFPASGSIVNLYTTNDEVQ